MQRMYITYGGGEGSLAVLRVESGVRHIDRWIVIEFGWDEIRACICVAVGAIEWE